jgi:hypothetical protein
MFIYLHKVEQFFFKTELVSPDGTIEDELGDDISREVSIGVTL